MKTVTARIHCRPNISDKTLKALVEMIRLTAKQRGQKLTDRLDITLIRQRDEDVQDSEFRNRVGKL